MNISLRLSTNFLTTHPFSPTNGQIALFGGPGNNHKHSVNANMCGILWYSVVYCGIFWYMCGMLWYIVVQCGIVWYIYCGI